MKKLLSLLGVLLLVGVFCPGISADIIVQATDNGSYDDSGNHDANNKNYIAGQLVDFMNNKVDFRNFFAFDVSAHAGSISSATFNAFLPASGYSSADANETFELYDFVGNVNDLLGGNGGVASFNDLGSGTSYGLQSVSQVDEGTNVVVTLNAAGIAALNNGTAGFVVIGGGLTTIDASATSSQIVFGLSGGDFPFLDITTSTIPEPASGVLLVALTIVLSGPRRRR